MIQGSFCVQMADNCLVCPVNFDCKLNDVESVEQSGNGDSRTERTASKLVKWGAFCISFDHILEDVKRHGMFSIRSCIVFSMDCSTFGMMEFRLFVE